jgi:DinB superfamily
MVIQTDKSIDTILATRKLFIKSMDGLSIDELNKIPDGFNNNIIWNFAHVVVTQQIICYKLSGLSLKIDAAYVSKYSKGTKPETFVDEASFEYFKTVSLQLIDEFVTDRANGKMNNFSAYTTSFGVELSSVDDAVKFLTMHEGLHLGYAMALKRIIKK